MIKVLHIISDTNIGGAGNALLNYLVCRDGAKFAVEVAIPRGGMLGERLAALDIPVHELDCLRDKSFELSAVRELRRLISEVSPDIVHTHGALSGRIAAAREKVPVIFTRHSAFPPSRRYTKGPGRTLYRFINTHYADRIIAVSPVCRDDLIKCGIPGDKIDVVINGVAPLPRLSTDERAAKRAEYGIAPDDFAAGIIARIEPYKGQIFVVEAAKILRDEGRRVKIIIAGTGSDEGLVRRRADELGVTDMLIFTGFVSDVPPLMNILDVQINASYVEATSLSLLEGMSIGLPAVASDAGGNPLVIRDGVNGLMFKARDSAALAGRIAELCDSPELRDTLGAGALSVYNEEYSAAKYAENIEEIYIKTLEERSNGK